MRGGRAGAASTWAALATPLKRLHCPQGPLCPWSIRPPTAHLSFIHSSTSRPSPTQPPHIRSYTYPSIRPSTHQSSTHQSSTHPPSHHPAICHPTIRHPLPIYPPVHPSTHPSFCPSFHPPIYPGGYSCVWGQHRFLRAEHRADRAQDRGLRWTEAFQEASLGITRLLCGPQGRLPEGERGRFWLGWAELDPGTGRWGRDRMLAELSASPTAAVIRNLLPLCSPRAGWSSVFLPHCLPQGEALPDPAASTERSLPCLPTQGQDTGPYMSPAPTPGLSP